MDIVQLQSDTIEHLSERLGRSREELEADLLDSYERGVIVQFWFEQF